MTCSPKCHQEYIGSRSETGSFHDHFLTRNTPNTGMCSKPEYAVLAYSVGMCILKKAKNAFYVFWRFGRFGLRARYLQVFVTFGWCFYQNERNYRNLTNDVFCPKWRKGDLPNIPEIDPKSTDFRSQKVPSKWPVFGTSKWPQNRCQKYLQKWQRN